MHERFTKVTVTAVVQEMGPLWRTLVDFSFYAPAERLTVEIGGIDLTRYGPIFESGMKFDHHGNGWITEPFPRGGLEGGLVIQLPTGQLGAPTELLWSNRA